MARTLEGMHAITHAAPPAADGLWAAFTALRLLQDAEDALQAAAAIGAALVVDSAWHSEGVSARALRGALAELHERLLAELMTLREQQGLVRAGVH